MNQALLQWIFIIACVIIGMITAIFYKKLPPPEEEPIELPPVVPTVPEPTAPIPAPVDPDNIFYPWDSPKHNYHNVRVLCDRSNLTVSEKNIICACIYQESQFYNYLPNGKPVSNQNRLANGSVGSTDWGICQVNDYYHLGVGKDFPSVNFALANPDKVVAWMIGMYQHGLLRQWVSFSSGAYRQWLSTASPMWILGQE